MNTNRIAPPAGWRDDGPDAFRKLPPTTARQARYSPLSAPDDDEPVLEVIYGDDQCTPSRRATLTAQPRAEWKYTTYAEYDSRFDPDLHPELDAPPALKPAKPVPQPVPVPAEPEGIPVAWPTRVTTPVPLSREVQP